VPATDGGRLGLTGGVRGHRRTIRHAWLRDQIRVVHAASRGSYGARRVVHADLTLGVGRQVGHNQVETLMARAGIKGLLGNQRPRPLHETPTATNPVERMFARRQPNRLWITYTEHHTYEGKMYCVVVSDTLAAGTLLVDRFQSDRGLGHQCPAHGHHQPRPPTWGADHGVQFPSWASPNAPRSGPVPSMAPIGDCYDCVVIEPFWGRMQTSC
jgi:putative transposase